MYDYTGDVRADFPLGKNMICLNYFSLSRQPGDLEIRESQRILIVERPSDDWRVYLYITVFSFTHLSPRWKAELDGKQGLVPASYVKIL